MSEKAASDTEQSFYEWLTEKIEDARDTYEAAPRSENPRQTDIAFGKIRAYRKARTEYLNREVATETNRKGRSTGGGDDA